MERRDASVAIVGAGDFIGAAIATRFAAEGFKLYPHDCASRFHRVSFVHYTPPCRCDAGCEAAERRLLLLRPPAPDEQNGRLCRRVQPLLPPANVLPKSATFFKQIRSGALRASQFPDEMRDAKGVFRVPARWRART